MRGFLRGQSASLPIRAFLLTLLLCAYLPIWLGSSDPWWRVKEWAVLMAGLGWLALRGSVNLRVSRSGQDRFLSILILGLLTHFFLLFVFPIVKAPAKLYQVPWPWMAMFHTALALVWIQDLRRLIRWEDIKFLFSCMAYLGVALSIYMLLQRFNLDPLIWVIQHKYRYFRWFHENHMIGLMGNPFQASAALCVLIPAIASRATKRGLLWKAFLLLSLCVCWFAQSRIAFASALVGTVIASGKVRGARAWLITSALASGVLAVTAYLRPEVLLDRNRLIIWSQALPHIQNHPFLGVGLNQFKLLNIRDPHPPGYAVRWAHNELVHFATELGLILTALIALYLIREALKLSRSHRGFFACFVSALLLTPLHIPFHLAPVLAVVGFGLIASHLEPEKEYV